MKKLSKEAIQTLERFYKEKEYLLENWKEYSNFKDFVKDFPEYEKFGAFDEEFFEEFDLHYLGLIVGDIHTDIMNRGIVIKLEKIIPINFNIKEFINMAQQLGFTKWAAEEIYDCFQAEYEFNGFTLPFIPKDWEEISINPTDDELENMRDGYKTIVHRTCVGTIVKGSIKLNVRNWYMENYPDDELGEEINSDASFKDVYEHLENIYDIIGVGDSIIRERIFVKLAEITAQSIDEIHKIWLGNN